MNAKFETVPHTGRICENSCQSRTFLSDSVISDNLVVWLNEKTATNSERNPSRRDHLHRCFLSQLTTSAVFTPLLTVSSLLPDLLCISRLGAGQWGGLLNCEDAKSFFEHFNQVFNYGSVCHNAAYSTPSFWALLSAKWACRELDSRVESCRMHG